MNIPVSEVPAAPARTGAPNEVAMAYEAIQSYQQLVETSLARLAEHTKALDAVVRDGLRRAFVEELQSLHQETDRAARTLGSLHRRALSRVFWITLASAAFGLGLGLVPTLWLIPSPQVIAQRQATLAMLNGHGGRAQVSECARPQGHSRLCVRIDRAAGFFGSTGDYALLHTD